jgi:NAD(P)-dependent dehydrogenase (short-subunit alcohol dehydrogenase family)
VRNLIAEPIAVMSIMFIRQLHAHLPAACPVIVNSVDPGYCASELQRNLTGAMRRIEPAFASLFANTPEEGARQVVRSSISISFLAILDERFRDGRSMRLSRIRTVTS